jgi:hypothetical protein
MDELSSLKKKVASQDQRIKKLEAAVYHDVYESDYDDSPVYESSKVVSTPVTAVSTPVRKGPSLSSNQIISILGVAGVSIGIISLFFYSITRGWIGDAAQVAIGVLVGLVLFFVAYMVREKKPAWSNIVFGGAYFLEYLSIGVGVSVYEVMPASIGVFFGFLILVSSIFLSVKFSSKIIAYFSLIGGFMIPIITDSFRSHIFVMVWYLLILIALTWLSISFNWDDLRAVMMFLIFIFVYSTFGNSEGVDRNVEYMFMFFYFILFNVSSLISCVLNSKEISVLDSVILGLLPAAFLPLLYEMLPPMSGRLFGLIVILFSFVYLLQALYLKSLNLSFPNARYALVSAGVIALNLGIYFMFEALDLDYFMIFFIVEWALFTYLSSVSKDLFYDVASFAFLGLVAIWYVFVLRFVDSAGHATFFMFVLALVPFLSFLFFRFNINYKASAATFIISGYFLIFSFFKYIWWFMQAPSLDQTREIILSVLWLIYTLVLFLQVQTSDGKMLVGFLLGVTLVKIAFIDLFSLPNPERIVGFIIFGILLLVGGYFLEHARKK